MSSLTIWKIDGVSLEDSGVSELSFSFANQASDQATLTLVDRGAPLRKWAIKTRVEIHRGSELFFVGWITDSGTRESQSDGGVQVVIKGPWWWLGEVTFAHVIPMAQGGGITTSVRLFKKGLFLIGLIDQIREILEWAKLKSGGAFNIGLLAPSEAPQMLPPEWVTGANCEDLIRKMAAWAPDSVFWWEYGPIPTLNWTAPGARKTHSFSKGHAPLKSADLYEDSDLAPAGVIIQYMQAKDEATGLAKVHIEDRAPDSAEAGQPGVAVFTLDKSEKRDASWAAKLFAMSRRFFWSGQITLENTQADIRPGDLVRVTGRPEWEGCEAMVQTVQIQPDNDGITMSLGPPAHLGLEDLRDLLWWMRDGASQTQQEEPVLSLHPFQVYAEQDELSSPFKLNIKVAPGFVNFGQTATMPVWNKRRLDAENPTDEPLKPGLRKTYFLKLTWIPDGAQFDALDAAGNQVALWRVVSTGKVESAEIVTTQQEQVAPEVNSRTGALMQEGIFFFPIATVEELDGKLRVTPHRNTDLNAFFIPPNYLYLTP